MEKQLVTGAYDKGKGPFMLVRGQIYSRMSNSQKLTHNSCWYNADGEQIGYGDLSVEDFQRISTWINKGELFIVLEPANTPCSPDQVSMYAKYIIEKHQVYEVIPPQYTDYHPAVGYVDRCGLMVKVLSQQEAAKLVARHNTK